LSEGDRAALERMAYGPGGFTSGDLIGAVRALCNLALEPQINTEETPPYHHLGIEADGFITIHPKI
jgi:hypothetical protein